MELYFEQHHESQAQTVVLLHGGGLSSKQWTPQIECLSDFHLLIPDLPEQGKSGGVFDLNEATEGVADLIATHGHGGKAHVVGLSLGGAVVLSLLHSYPDRVQTSLVTGTSGKLSKLLGQVMAWSADTTRLFSANWLVNTSIRTFGIDPAYRDLVVDDLKRALDPGFNRRIAQALMTLDMPTANTRPLLVLVGEKETMTAKQAARQIYKTVPNAKAATVPGVGHVWNLQKPALFCEVVRKWVAEGAVAAPLHPL
jgi:pimeloyl-ACP methyl ester carboxylesterase